MTRRPAEEVSDVPGKKKPNVGYIVIGVLVAVVLIAWGVISLRGGGSSSSSPEAATYPTVVKGATVVAGNQAASKVDVYEDFLCPICGRFESQFGDDLAKAIGEGKIQVVYHPVAILNRATNPTGYSLRAANAAMCSAEAGVFVPYHKKLFAEQPEEGSAGLSDEDLIAKGQAVNAPASFAQCVKSGKFNGAVTAETARAGRDESLRAKGSKGFGTPTVTVNGTRADLSSGSWLTDLTKAN
jgi:protein-disulfide isomerase